VVEPKTGITLATPVFILMLFCIVGLGALAAYPYLFKPSSEKDLTQIDSSRINEPDTTSFVQEEALDTGNQIKPILLDTTVQETNIDSLKKEYERQQGITNKSVTPAKPEKEKTDSYIVSEGKKYKMPKTALYFYDAPQDDSPKHGVIGLWVNTKFNVVDEQNGFIYVTHTDNDNQVTKGWVSKKDLTEVP